MCGDKLPTIRVDRLREVVPVTYNLTTCVLTIVVTGFGTTGSNLNLLLPHDEVDNGVVVQVSSGTEETIRSDDTFTRVTYTMLFLIISMGLTSRELVNKVVVPDNG